MPNDKPRTDPPQSSAPTPPMNETVPPAAPQDPAATISTDAMAFADADQLRAARRVPGYQILRELGRGGMGVVYEAQQEGLDRVVALKMILSGEHASDEELMRFRTEGLANAKLQHPNIVQVYAVGSHDGFPFFVLEYCAGGTLAQRFVPGQGMELNEAVELVAVLSRAIHAAHEVGIIHRDIKPGNILFASDGTPKVTDFGLAKQLHSPLTQTQSGVIMGTPAYMSPEQATGHVRAVGPPTDVFALGVILYEALAGRRPFDAPTAWETLQMVCTQDPPSLRSLRPEVPADLEAIVLQCLDRNPQNRYGTAADLADDLDRWQRGEPVRARGQSTLHRLGTRLRKHRGKVAAAVVGGMVLFPLWVGLSDAGYRLPGSSTVNRWLDRYEASVFRPVPSEETLQAAAANHRAVLRQRLLDMVVSRDGWFAPPGVGPDPWTQMQGTVALFSCPDPDHRHYDKCVDRLDRMFEPNRECGAFLPRFGWTILHDGNMSAEPLAWGLLAIASTFRAPDLLSDEDRSCLLARLEQIQTALDNYRSHDRESGRPLGSWNIFAGQDDPGLGNLYITLMVCQGLLELARADLPWHDSNAVRDQLLDESIAWLIERFDGRGWSTPSTISDQYNDGFSLQIFATLLDAEAGGHLTLPDAILHAIPQTLAECGTYSAEHQSPVALYGASFTNHHGKHVGWSERRMRPLWYPWAVSTAAGWLRRCQRIGAPHDEVVRTRRILGHLLLTLGPTVIEAANKGETFVTTEILFGLNSIGGIRHADP